MSHVCFPCPDDGIGRVVTSHQTMTLAKHAKVKWASCFERDKCGSRSPFNLTIVYFPLLGWLVGCGLTLHSAIFQLYSDGTVVKFPNFDLLPGTQRHGQLGVFSASISRHGHRDVRRHLLPPCHQRAHTQWGYAGNLTRIVWSTVQPGTFTPLRRASLLGCYLQISIPTSNHCKMYFLPKCEMLAISPPQHPFPTPPIFFQMC